MPRGARGKGAVLLVEFLLAISLVLIGGCVDLCFLDLSVCVEINVLV